MSLEQCLELLKQKVEQANRYYELQFLTDTLNYPSFVEAVEELGRYIALLKQIDTDYQQATNLLKEYWGLIKDQAGVVSRVINKVSAGDFFTAINQFILHQKMKFLFNHENVKLRELAYFLKSTSHFDHISKAVQFEKLYDSANPLQNGINKVIALRLIEGAWQNMQKSDAELQGLTTLFPTLSHEVEHSIYMEYFTCREALTPQRHPSPVPA